ncbi:hypothetical protein WA1_24745 [Scytonema hofmannii PCC 7110]|uniref:DUF2157 domain-containing protein n=1 Tax=Scytonema hofmannii PCC 7110 TaxID=128403 RepID=A0A139X813_9CYAN|nr:hypothetical protein [Scytonema hofmannii]KYC40834.1 hypothetical protein WA1_24745 [Scytonema hofmannii PCC 7110]
MSPNLDPPLKIEIRLPSNHPELLQGLDIWLDLGLISDAQVRQICQEHLVCRVVLEPQALPKLQQSVAHNNVEKLLVASLPQGKQPIPQKPNILAQMLQSLGEELSVRWLLFLGMFLVVVSSGVLAASQWDRFPPSGQYGVLLAYTLSFWGVSFWTGKQSNLSLTTRALLIVTLLLVPVNFWAMDSFRLWQNPLNWIVIAIASTVLTVVTVLSSHNRLFETNNKITKSILFNVLGLSYLHWGWQLPGFPLIAVYLATIGTAIASLYRTHYQKNSPTKGSHFYGDSPHNSAPPLKQEGDVPSPTQSKEKSTNLYTAIIIFALIVLLGRAIFIAKVDIQQLGLALGICGWLVTWLSSPPRPLTPLPSPHLSWEPLGGILLLLGWLVSVGTPFPWQATVVSFLGLWFFNRRLQHNGVRADVGAIFIIGLETIWLGWRLVPDNFQQSLVTLATQLVGSQNAPWELLSVALFPYIILMLALADRCYRANKVKLAHFAELLTLLFGILLTAISLANPTLRSVNLVLSTIALWRVSQRRPLTRDYLVYMTQMALVLTICSVVDSILPTLTQEVWASLLLVIAIAEWLLSPGLGIWRRSAWHMGLGLAVLSYILLWGNAHLVWIGSGNGSENLGLIWLVTPMTLTSLASWGYKTQTSAASRSISNIWLSIAALGLAQLLTLPLAGGRLIGLAVATALMFVNTYYLRQKPWAVMTVGYGLGAIAALLWEGVPGLPKLSAQGWFVVGAVTITILWILRKWFDNKRTKNTEKVEVPDTSSTLPQIYAIAFDRWAMALCIAELLLLSIHSLLVYQNLVEPGFLYLISSTVTLSAIVYRSWQQPNDWGFYGIAWCLELFIAELLGFGEHSLIQIAIANVTLGLMTQLLGEFWQRRHQLAKLPNRWHILPLVYGVFGVLLRTQTLTNWTGLSSFAVALIAIGVGRRNQKYKPLVYLGLIGVSVSAYELLLYQLLQASSGAYGDGFIAMSVLGTGIMYAYRVLSPWLLNYLRLTSQELSAIAHIHWFFSSSLLVAACLSPIEARTLGLGTGLFLIRYAIFQGRRSSDSITPQKNKNSLTPTPYSPLPTPSFWVYIGLLQIACLRAFLPDIPIIELLEKQLLPWLGAIASVIAYFLYILPWETWGWDRTPWRRSAYFLPLIFLWQTRVEVLPISLIVAASFYAIVAKTGNKFRLTYISLALGNWALFRWFAVLNFTGALWYVTPIGLSLLYIAQFDPDLKLPNMKSFRHFLRLLGCGIICGWAIVFNQNAPFIPGIFSLIAVFAGLALRVRAFLYIGVTAFFITSFYQLVLLSLQYSFFKWVVGLLVGIALLTIAANFETRREQLNSLLRNASQQLQAWE